jgi:hypothetical protein
LACIGGAAVAYFIYKSNIEPIYTESQLDKLKKDKLVAILHHEHNLFKEHFDQQLEDLAIKQGKSVGIKRIEMFGGTVEYSMKEDLNSFKNAIWTKVSKLEGKVAGDERYLYHPPSENQVDQILFKYQMENLESEIWGEIINLKTRTAELQKQLLVYEYHDLLQELFSEEEELSEEQIIHWLEAKLKVEKENVNVVWCRLTDEKTGIVRKKYNSPSYTFDKYCVERIISERKIHFARRDYLISKDERP